MEDVRKAIVPYLFGMPKEEFKAAGIAKMVEGLGSFFVKCEFLLKGRKFLGGSSPTIADFFFFENITVSSVFLKEHGYEE